MTLYSLLQVRKVYGSRTILDIDSMEIGNRGIYSLLGPNGAGKTTLLKILGFLEHPTTGRVSFCSKPVLFSESHLHPLRKKVVMVGQHPILFSTTVFKNLEFGLKIRQIPKIRRMQIIEEALELVDMQHMAQAQAHRLSGGETQRVALARALALSPDVILCDEPTSSVDLENQAAIIKLLRQINEHKKITIVFTCHDKLQASSLAHHTIFLEHGKLATASYENLFTGVLTENSSGEGRCRIQNTLNLPVDTDKKGKIRLFIDPEKISIAQNSGSVLEKNHYLGSVVQISKENNKVRVVIDMDVFITLILSQKQYRNQQIMVGENVRVAIPAEALQIL